MATLVAVGRMRWKSEKLKDQRHHVEHNFGHGSPDLANVLAVLLLGSTPYGGGMIDGLLTSICGRDWVRTKLFS